MGIRIFQCIYFSIKYYEITKCLHFFSLKYSLITIVLINRNYNIYKHLIRPISFRSTPPVVIYIISALYHHDCMKSMAGWLLNHKLTLADNV